MLHFHRVKKMLKHLKQEPLTVSEPSLAFRFLRVIVLSAALFTMTSPVVANDSTARISVGGLVFLKSNDTRMTSEVLSVSATHINVRYLFRNDAANDIDATVAFPMPAFEWNPQQSAWDANVGPIETFSVVVNGRPIATQVERKALLAERDITSTLRTDGLTDAQIFRTFGDMTLKGHGLSAAQIQKLTQLGAFQNDAPMWRVKETAYWGQKFPGDGDIAVEHNYKPLSGSSYNIFSADSDFAAPERLPIGTSPEDQKREDRACLREGGRNAIIKRMTTLFKQGAKTVRVTLDDVEYVLGTGRNWKGPISDFTLDIVKATPDQIVSLCFPGKAIRVDDLTLRFQQTSFLPPERLLVYFYTVKVDK